ncbi:MAG: acylhydrolase, partial [Bacteroidetes bacterium]|nr:acylhydrolase [Bacteroidota bacterium]
MRHYFANNKVKIQAVALIFFSIISTNAEAQCNDFANLGKYKASNDIEKKGAAVFFGNSITEMWKETDPAFFADNHFINRGISGQTTSQMLLRFRQDVIGLQPRIVAILCGINDIAENTGPISVGDIENNIKCMAELGKYHHIKIILCSILPSNY